MSKIYGIPTATPINPEKFGGGGGGSVPTFRVNLSWLNEDQFYIGDGTTTSDIYHAYGAGKRVVAYCDELSEFWTLVYCSLDVAIFEYLSDDCYSSRVFVYPDGTVEFYVDELVRRDWDGNLSTNPPKNPLDCATKQYVDDSVGDIETALDSIIAIQNELIGGDGV